MYDRLVGFEQVFGFGLSLHRVRLCKGLVAECPFLVYNGYQVIKHSLITNVLSVIMHVYHSLKNLDFDCDHPYPQRPVMEVLQ